MYTQLLKHKSAYYEHVVRDMYSMTERKHFSVCIHVVIFFSDLRIR